MIEIENFLRNSEYKNLRFVPIFSNNEISDYYYDCLCSQVVYLKSKKIKQWMSEEKVYYPFIKERNISTKRIPSFNKYSWNIAMENAYKITQFLLKNSVYFMNKSMVQFNMIEDIILKLDGYYELKVYTNYIGLTDSLKEKLNFIKNEYTKFSYLEKIEKSRLKEKDEYIKLIKNFNLMKKYGLKNLEKEFESLNDLIRNNWNNLEKIEKELIVFNEDTTNTLEIVAKTKLDEYFNSLSIK